MVFVVLNSRCEIIDLLIGLLLSVLVSSLFVSCCGENIMLGFNSCSCLRLCCWFMSVIVCIDGVILWIVRMMNVFLVLFECSVSIVWVVVVLVFFSIVWLVVLLMIRLVVVG